MKQTVIIFFIFILMFTVQAEVVRNEEVFKTVNLLNSCSRNGEYTMVERDYYPPNYSLLATVNVIDCTNMSVQLWDGSQWNNVLSWEFNFANGLVTSFYQYMYYAGNVVTYYYHDIIYNADDHITECWMDMDFGNGWVNGSNELFQYGNDGLNYWILYGDYGIGVYENQEKANISYSNGLPNEILYENWDGNWVCDYRYSLTYDGNLPETNLYEEFDGTQWSNIFFYNYTMIDQYFPEEILIDEWNGAWENYNRITFTYPRYNYEERLMEEWIAGAWENDVLDVTTFDNEDRPIQVDQYEWDGTDWTDYMKYTISYGPANVNPNTVVPISNVLNYPNPFNPETTIKFDLSQNTPVKIEIFNLKGEIILSETIPAGKNQFVWNASKQASGIYFYKISDGNFSETKKMILMK